MAVNITNTTQLNTFDLIKGIITSHATLGLKFNSSNIYEFDPLEKGLGFNGFPYIVISIPDTNTDLLVMDHTETIKEFEVTISMVMGWEARANLKTYLSYLIYQLEASSSTFETSGYFNTKAEITGTTTEVINQKQVVVGEVSLMLSGGVAR